MISLIPRIPDRDSGSDNPFERSDARCDAPGNSPAYVIFTSGSSGVPKGVVVSRASLARYVDWAGTAFSRHGPVTMPLFTSLSYDLAITSVFVPLTTGGAINIYRSSDRIEDASLIRQILSVDRHDVIKMTPSHLLVAADVPPQLDRLQSIVLGGEGLPSELARLFADKLGDSVSIINEYGPTEATVGCMVHVFDPDRDRDDFVPIGTGNEYTEVLLLDAFGNEVPDGVVAELAVAGPGLADGYLNEPELTAGSFVKHPFVKGATIYRTGDAAVRSESGRFMYLGRIDDQVKVAGVRIELGEIETRMAELPGVTGAAIAMRKTAFTATPTSEERCARCGLSTLHPGTVLDSDGICNVCKRFDDYSERATDYFQDETMLRDIFDKSRTAHPDAEYDCLALLSGGKDSTYALGRLVDMGLNVHAFTLDNGYISEEALANISRVVQELGVSHEFGRTDAMNEVFVDSLRRHSNVCNGCFKVIYTLALQRADALNIPIIVTGLSRGQFFETRLTPELFESVEYPLQQIDDTVLAARKSYHKVKDAVFENFDTTFLRDGDLLDEIRFVDFYRYTDVSLEQMMEYLDSRLPWIRPSDTGRSTNCLINDAGIYVHKKERGYHNYAWPYSWDVRVGHKQRGEALEELDDEIDIARTTTILKEIGYKIRHTPPKLSKTELHSFYVAPEDVPVSEIREYLRLKIPNQAIPTTFTRVESIPLTENGKVDRSRLLDQIVSLKAVGHVGPENEIEEIIHGIWCELLGLESLSTDLHFLDSGGNSILAIQAIARVKHAFDIEFPFSMAFEAPTIRELAALVEHTLLIELDQTNGSNSDAATAEKLGGRENQSDESQAGKDRIG